MVRFSFAFVVVLAVLSLACPSVGGEPGWIGQVVKPRSQREQINQTPIVYRSYRPLHFYGNTVRRMYYHGRVLPMPSELQTGWYAFSTRRIYTDLGYAP